jgi:hypothetical protein
MIAPLFFLEGSTALYFVMLQIQLLLEFALTIQHASTCETRDKIKPMLSCRA